MTDFRAAFAPFQGKTWLNCAHQGPLPNVAADAARTAALAGVHELVLTHISTAYHLDPQPLLDEAKEHFQGPITVASDLYQISVGTA